MLGNPSGIGHFLAARKLSLFSDTRQLLDVLDEIFVILLVVGRRSRLNSDLVARCVAIEFNLGAQFEYKLFEVGRAEQCLAFALIALEQFADFLRCLADDRFGGVGKACCPTI